MSINNQNPTFNSLFPTYLPSNTGRKGGLIPARVTEVSIRPNKKDTSLYVLSDNEFGIGAIRFEPIGKNSKLTDNPSGNIAFPLDINYRKIPLINEIVFVIIGPSLKSVTEGDSEATTFYYTSAINIWNSNHLNPLPSQINQGNNSTNTNTRNIIEDDIPNNPGNLKLGPKYGDIFEENKDIRNLYPQEGDIILEGRFGNSLRFSSTAKQTGSFTIEEVESNIQSPWSSEGKDGDPITILRNGQGAGISFDNWIPLYEDININDSSIYLTSTQNIPLETAYPKLSSYGIDIPTPDDTTAQFQKTAEATGNEFTSNKEADNIEKPYDSVNVEPNLND